MALKKIVPAETVRESIGDSMVECWGRCEHFIKARRKEREGKGKKIRKYYMYFFDKFVKDNKSKIYDMP